MFEDIITSDDGIITDKEWSEIVDNDGDRKILRRYIEYFLDENADNPDYTEYDAIAEIIGRGLQSINEEKGIV